MSRPPLTVVGSETGPSLRERRAREVADRLLSGEGDFLVMFEDGEISGYGESLRLFSLGEEMCRIAKMGELGLIE